MKCSQILKSVFILCFLWGIHSTYGIDKKILVEEISAQSPETLKVLNSSPKGQAFLKKFFSDGELLVHYLCAGFARDSHENTLKRFYKLYSQRPDCLSDSVLKKLSVACVYQLIDDESNPETALLPKYDFYSKSYKEKKLRTSFNKLQAAQMRIIVTFGRLEDLQFMQGNFNLPLSKYSVVHDMVGWSRYNEFGQSVHGGDFRSPYYAAGMTRAESIMRHGAVCGGRSTFAVLHACSKGVPAVLVGATGHCAFMVDMPGKGWVRCYGGYNGGGAEDPIFKGDVTPYMYLTREIFQDLPKYYESMKMVWKAKKLIRQGAAKADIMEAFNQAVNKQSINYAAWYDQIQWMVSKASSMTKSDWKKLSDGIVRSYAKYPGVLVRIAKIYHKEKIMGERYATESLVDVAGKGAWTSANSKPLVTFMRKIYGPLSIDHDKHYFRYLFFSKFASTPFFGPCYKHMHERLAYKGKPLEMFTKDLAKILLTQDNLHPSAVKTICARVIRTAIAEEDLETLSKISKVIGKFLGENEHKALKSVSDVGSTGGTLLTRNAYLTSKHFYKTNYLLYFGTFGTTGGNVQVKASKDMAVDLKLYKPCKITDIVIHTDNNRKLKAAKYRLSVSLDGKSWKQVAETSTQPIKWNVNLKSKNISAQYVRLTRIGTDQSKTTIAIRRFLAFGERSP